MPSLAAVIAFCLCRRLTEGIGRCTQKRHAVMAAGVARSVEAWHTSPPLLFVILFPENDNLVPPVAPIKTTCLHRCCASEPPARVLIWPVKLAGEKRRVSAMSDSFHVCLAC